MKGLLILLVIITSMLQIGFAQDQMQTNNSNHPVDQNNQIISSIKLSNLKDGQETIGPWKLTCQTRKFPNRWLPTVKLKPQQFEIQDCYAEQTVQKNIHERIITATLKITPARVFFETENIVDRHKHAKLIIGEQQKWYSLYTNCYKKSNITTCLLFPDEKTINEAIIREMKKNNQFMIKLIDHQTHQSVLLTFDLTHFTKIYPIIEDTYRTMEEILQRYSEILLFNDQDLGNPLLSIHRMLRQPLAKLFTTPFHRLSDKIFL